MMFGNDEGSLLVALQQIKLCVRKRYLWVSVRHKGDLRGRRDLSKRTLLYNQILPT